MGKLVHCIVEKEDGCFPGSQVLQLASVPYKDIAALASSVEMRSWERMGEEELHGKLSWFQAINISILKEHEMIPLKFGVIAEDEQIIRNFLAGAYLPIKSAFDKVRGRVEYLVLVGCDLKAMLGKIAGERKIAVGGTPLPDPLRAIEIGKSLFEAAQAKKRGIVEAVHQKLSSLSVASSEGKCTNDSMIMNWSYLVEKEKAPAFDQAMEELGRECEAYLAFRYLGPLPPYSFVSLRFERANYDSIEGARNLLALPARASLKEIKAAYRKLSLIYHPDRNPGSFEAEECFKKMAAAYALLKAYCGSLLGSPEIEEGIPCSFAREDVERVFLVREEM